MLDPILSRLRTLLAFVTQHSISVDLRPETGAMERLISSYYEGVSRLQDAHKAFLAAKNLWVELHKDD